MNAPTDSLNHDAPRDEALSDIGHWSKSPTLDTRIEGKTGSEVTRRAYFPQHCIPRNLVWDLRLSMNLLRCLVLRANHSDRVQRQIGEGRLGERWV